MLMDATTLFHALYFLQLTCSERFFSDCVLLQCVGTYVEVCTIKSLSSTSLLWNSDLKEISATTIFQFG